MKSLILQTATRSLLPLLVLFSVFLLLEGHNQPGGGFIGGLTASAALALAALALNVREVRRFLPLDPHRIIGIGLLLAAAAGAGGLVRGKPFLTSAWGAVQLPADRHAEVGTPLLFDLGVYLVVVGVVLLILLTLAEE
jgi:multicomponent Na+:H+ antiporter subunit B